MKVLLRRNVPKIGKIGEVVDVADSFARNYLLPQALAIKPTTANLKAVEAEKEQYFKELAAERDAMIARAAKIQGKEVTITARANDEGHLYGSIGPAQIRAALAEAQIFVEANQVRLDEHIRKLDKHEVVIELADDVKATISVWVVPLHGDKGDEAEEAAEQKAPDQAGQ